MKYLALTHLERSPIRDFMGILLVVLTAALYAAERSTADSVRSATEAGAAGKAPVAVQSMATQGDLAQAPAGILF